MVLFLFFILGDISKFEDNQDDEGLLTLKEILLTSRVTTTNGQQNSGKKPPRPSSIPAAKKFGQVKSF